MCLRIDPKKHKKRGQNYISHKTKRNLIVYKRLSYYSNYDNYSFYTPFQRLQVKIGEKGSILKARFTYSYFHNEINTGIHAYATKKRAIRSMRYNPGGIIIKATIPKGTRYYLGDDGDIVAMKMKIGEIIYGKSKLIPKLLKNTL